MSERVCLVSYHEIGLKGRNRSGFERRLQGNLDAALVGLPVRPTQRAASRLTVRVTDVQALSEVAERIAAVPGVGSVALAFLVSQDPGLMEQVALEALDEAAPYETFKVDAKRSNTNYAESSMDINRRIGAFLGARTPARVDLDNPDVTVGVTVTQGDAYVFSRRLRGIGGLPVGSASTVVSLLSSGIDSPVATWRMMRRGAVAVGVHFSGRPQVSGESERLVAKIGSVLEGTGGLGRVYVVPFGDLQKEIALECPPDLRVIMYRRLMIKVAEAIAVPERGKALVTGESLGQVASQTLENIAAVDDAATLPVLRPLVGSDKLEIMAEARRIGTYELSIRAAEDCCTLFMPRNPETHAKLADVLEAWSRLDTERMVDQSLRALEWLDFLCPAYRPPKRWPTPAGAPGWSAARAAEHAAGGTAGPQ
jgi:thiamine biosynthesis protein ThiI